DVCCPTPKALDEFTSHLRDLRSKMDDLNEIQAVASKEKDLSEATATALNENLKSLLSSVALCQQSSTAVLDKAASSAVKNKVQDNVEVVENLKMQVESLQKLLEPKEA